MKTSFKPKLVVGALVGALASVAATAQADDSVSTPTAAPAMASAPTDEAPWQFGVTVPLWMAGINGNATILGHQQNLDVSFNTLLDHLDTSVALGFDASKGKFDFYSDVTYMKFTGGFGDEVGGHTDARLRFAISNARVSYQLIKTESERPFTLAGTAGVRFFYLSTTLNHHDFNGNRDWSGYANYNVFDPVIGLRASQYLTQKLHLDVMGDGGGFNLSHDTDWTWSAAGVATYDFTKWFSFSAGYQAVAVDESTGGNKPNGVNLILNGALLEARFNF